MYELFLGRFFMMYTINFAMQITLLRILLTPCVIAAIFYDQWMCALVLAMIAAATDFFDGYVARKYNQETQLGKLMDPVADKVFIFFILYALYGALGENVIPSWFVMILFTKELLLLCGACLLAWHKFFTMSPSLFSKFVTAVLMLFILYIILVHSQAVSPYFSDGTTHGIFQCLAIATVGICVDYGYKVYKILVSTQQ
jgi:cardiolipin synthase